MADETPLFEVVFPQIGFWAERSYSARFFIGSWGFKDKFIVPAVKHRMISGMRCKSWEGKKEILIRCARRPRPYAAHTERSQEATPIEWAKTYKSLGDALAVVGIDEGQAERLIDAVDAYQQALRGPSRELAPPAWEFTQNNLGKVLQALGEKVSGSGHLHQAAAAYQAALLDGVLCPSSIAAANNNLGNALLVIGERENSIVSLKEASRLPRGFGGSARECRSA